MKKKLCQLLAALCVLPATLATAQTQTLPVGYWEAVFYYAPGGGHYANQGVCFSANNTWYGTTQHWNGNWFLNGAEFEWYGTAPIVQGGTSTNIATIGTSQFAAGTMAGNYAEWIVPGTPPLSWDKHYTYQLIYQGAVCPPAA
ncbi:hypothetical protein [Burkholderia gladioli]|uniref:hypothetical protein n=1 Tax=Burkholderia gladioli TaxID=28095 RepID=UPI00164102CB|nr:hypothetical protein [Burkholderia gladioli]